MSEIQIINYSDLDWAKFVTGLEFEWELPLKSLATTIGLKHANHGLLVGRIRAEAAFLSLLYVVPEKRSQGIGGLLLDEFIDLCTQNSSKFILVSGKTGNAPGYLQPGINESDGAARHLLLGRKFNSVGLVHSMSKSLKAPLIVQSSSLWKIVRADVSQSRELSDAISKADPGDWSNFFIDALGNPQSNILIATQNGEIGGYCHWREERFGPIGVMPVARGKGLGSLLVNSALSEMKARGATKAWFSWSDESNVPFYERLGFQTAHKFERFELIL